MEKRHYFYWGLGVVFLLVLFGSFFWDFGSEFDEGDAVPRENLRDDLVDKKIDFEKYNFGFADDEGVKAALTRGIGSTGKSAFYLPSVNYINVSRGNGFGVIYAIQNPNPSSPDNYFEFTWKVNNDSLEGCGVSGDEAQSWIKRGQRSFGKLPKGAVDHLAVYFEFPLGVEPCNLKYDFVLTRDGLYYESKVLEFNLL